MISLRKINPMARAIGTMGAVAALVGGITFAATGLTSNTVALSPNTLTTATASLAIASGTSCNNSPDTGAGDGPSTPGLNDSSLVPGGSTSVNFCLDNTGGVPLTVSASIPQDLSGSTAAGDTSLTVTCNTEGSIGPQALSTWSGGAFGTALPAGTSDNCTATAALNSTYGGSGGEVIPAFAIDFVGNQPSS